MKKELSLGLASLGLALLVGVMLSVFVFTEAKADYQCNPLPRGPFTWLSCNTGANCSNPTPYYVMECYGTYEGSGAPCDCEWVGCHSGVGICD